MNEKTIKQTIARYARKIEKIYPVRKVFLYGSHAKNNASADSDIDVGVVIDSTEHEKRIEITADLFHIAREIDARIEPKCIFLDEYQNHEKASILSEIIRNGIHVYSNQK